MKKILLTFVAILAATFVSWAEDDSPMQALNVSVTSLIPGNAIDPEDGTFKMDVEYSIVGTETLIIPDLVFNYEVTDDKGNVVDAGEKNPTDITDGKLSIYVKNLVAGSTYKFAVTKVTVFDYAFADWDTGEVYPMFVKDGFILDIEFTVPGADDNVPGALDVNVTSLTSTIAIDAEDESLKVELQYQFDGLENLIMPDVVFGYAVTDAEGNKVDSGEKNPIDAAAGKLNIYVYNLKVGETYKLTVTKITVYDYANMDWDTFETPASLEKEGELGSVEFTVSARIGVNVTKLTPDNALDAEDGSFKVVLDYEMTGAEGLFIPDVVFNYEVTDAEGNVVASGEKNPTDITAGTLNIFANGLETGKAYKLTITKITVYDYANMDYETFETPASLEKEGELGSVEFSINPTGIENSTVKTKAGKIYSVNGMELRKVQKGINIVNGKKILVK